MPVTVPIADAISASIDDLSRADAPQASEAPVETATETPSPEPQAEAPVPATPEPASVTPAPPEPPLDDESTVPATGNIPVERHKAILNKYRSKADQLKWAEALNPQELQQKLAILEFAEQNPQEFVKRFQAALQTDPRYATPAPAPVSQAAEVKPEPDVLLSDGTLTYSQPQLDKLLEWRERQIVSRFEPVEKAYRSTQVWNQAVDHASKQLADARQHWPGFQGAETDIAGYLRANPTASLEQAYRATVIPKMQTDEARIRAEERQRVLDELKLKSGVTSTRAASAALPPRDPETGRWRSPGEIAREEYERLTAT